MVGLWSRDDIRWWLASVFHNNYCKCCRCKQLAVNGFAEVRQ